MTANTPPSATPADDHPVDGRRQRGQRSRTAVTDAVLALLSEGNVSPTAEDISARSGVSVSSLFRHFTSIADVQRQTLERFAATYWHLLDIPNIGEGDLPTRVNSFVSGRVELYVQAAPMMRVARLRAIEAPTLSDGVHALQSTLLTQTLQHFAPELHNVSGELSADDIASTITSLTSASMWDLMSEVYGRTPDQVITIWSAGITGLLATLPHA